MSYFKIIFSSFLKRKLTYLLIVIQLVITFLMLIKVFTNISVFYYQENSIKKYTNLDMNKTVRVIFEYSEETPSFVDKFNVLKQYINSLEGVRGYGGYDGTGMYINDLAENEDYINLNKKIYKNTFREENPGISEIFYTDEICYNILDIEIYEGRSLNKDDFNTDNVEEIPILAGYKYKDIIKLGTVLTVGDQKEKFKVVGIMKPNNKWFSDDDYIRLPLEDIDSRFIIPFTPTQKNDLMSTLCMLHKMFFVLDSSDDFLTLSEQIERKALDLGLKVSCVTMAQELQEYKNEKLETFKINIFISIFFMIAALSGTTAVILSSIIQRKREFGIRLATGASINSLKIIIVGEIMLITIISAIVAFAISYLNNYTSISLYKEIVFDLFKDEVLLFILASIIIMTFASSILPIIKINRLQPRELIGGRE
ncbi:MULTISPECIES: ABC transporter permease [Acetivibrio]|uniref:FtsX-like permease family protein n=1 Tax=Acetivibrio saccincola TaxID=1677857 RepID=A0A2K9E3B1_9FIRM|nr:MULTISPECIES: ABC transporter permease [Acetivibrio]AUG56858.1 FtsX-like permease family protein [Acetivibrio saccincola]HPT90875.1 ABC transporter permease [Acetivibrio sp.]